MHKSKQQLLLLGIGMVIFGALWASYKNCNAGCSTFAEHLVEHGLQDIVIGLT
jgi:hypothetical protein